jgi:hypothetical protein
MRDLRRGRIDLPIPIGRAKTVCLEYHAEPKSEFKVEIRAQPDGRLTRMDL